MTAPAALRCVRLRYQLPMMRGETALTAQRALARHGALALSEVDGLYGPRSRAAAMRFQSARGLPVTGEIGTDDWDALWAPTVKAAPPPARPVATGLVDDADLPPAAARRVILHWTGGGPRASSIDREHYHFLVEQDGTIVRGRHSIADNDTARDGRYARHTLGLNTGSVGLAVCGMLDARERPFHPGPAPINARQLDILCALTARICARYGIEPGPATVLGHGEVQATLKVAQRQKWDPLVLPWNPGLSRAEVGDLMRAKVALALRGGDDAAEVRRIDVLLGDRRIPDGGALFDCAAWLSLAALAQRLGWSVGAPDGDGVAIEAGGKRALVPFVFAPDENLVRDVASEGYVRVEDVAEQFGLGAEMDAAGDALALAGEIDGKAVPTAEGTYRAIPFGRCDTLSRIAARELGDPARWVDLRSAEGAPFDDASARRLRAGQMILVPQGGGQAFAAATAAATVPTAGRLREIGLSVAGEADPVNRDAAVEATARLLAACMAENIRDPAHWAYVLATAEHETNFGRFMVEIWRNTDAQRRYEKNGSNSKPGDGYLFRGRGYVQLTFRENYRRFGESLGLPLEDEPDRAAEPETAARIMAVGMGRLGYRGANLVLRRFGEGDGFDFDGARAIVNRDVMTISGRYGGPVGPAIGARARRFHRILLESAPIA